MPTRRRRCPPRSRKALRDYPQLFRSRPSTAATRVNNFKATDVASVSKVIHTDNQLQAGQFGKAAYTGWIPCAQRGAEQFDHLHHEDALVDRHLHALEARLIGG